MGTLLVPNDDGKLKDLIDVASLASLERQLDAKEFDGRAIWKDASVWNIESEILTAWLDQAANGIAHAIQTAQAIVDAESVIIDGWLPSDVLAELTKKNEKTVACKRQCRCERAGNPGRHSWGRRSHPRRRQPSAERSVSNLVGFRAHSAKPKRFYTASVRILISGCWNSPRVTGAVSILTVELPGLSSKRVSLPPLPLSIYCTDVLGSLLCILSDARQRLADISQAFIAIFDRKVGENIKKRVLAGRDRTS